MVLHFLSEHGMIAIKHRYRLKEAIMRMGPAGFPFETYIGQILGHFGYTTKSIRTEIIGRCVKHEVDLILESIQDGKKWPVECKYHNMPGRYKDSKNPCIRMHDFWTYLINLMVKCLFAIPRYRQM